MQDTEQEMSAEEQAFHDGYDNTLLFLENRIKYSKVNVHDLEGELHHLTIYEGQDWVGRGEVKNSEIQGQIYAYMAMIDTLKKQASTKKSK